MDITFSSPLTDIPGIGTGAAYATGDAFGTGLWISLPGKGYIDTLTFIDLDNEGIAKTIILFDTEVTTSNDNTAFDPTAANLSTARQINLTTADFVTFANNRMATVTGIGLAYDAPNGRLWCRLVTRGSDNIASAKIPQISFSGRQR